MSFSLRTGKKKEFLRWFLDHQNLKWPSTARLLEFLLEDQHWLDQVVFVDDISGRPNAMMISAKGTGTVPFVFKLNGAHIHSIEDALAILRREKAREIYIRLSYQPPFFCSLCEKSGAGLDQIAVESKIITQPQPVENQLIENVWATQIRKKMILQEIDNALDAGDITSFIILTKKLLSLVG